MASDKRREGSTMKTMWLLVWLTFAGAVVAQETIPAGTVLPVRLNSAINSKNAQAGRMVTARLMQDVPLGSGMRLAAGSKLIGHILAATRAKDHSGSDVSLRFDTIRSSKKEFSITTDLRALASPLDVDQAQLPKYGPDRGTPKTSWTTEQIGGDVVYRGGGPVTAGSLVVGTPVANGVLVETLAIPGTRCEGEVEDKRPQALWVFSANACGVYGYSKLMIEHTGRTAPVGEIKLVSQKKNLNLRTGSGLLLRVR